MLLETRNLSFRYNSLRWILRNMSLSFETGQRIGLLGPSGFGKSTLARLLAGFLRPTEGEVLLDGANVPRTGFRPVQLIYQHPELAVNPRMTLGETLNEGYTPGEELLDCFGIERAWLNRYPGELSGGELQRFCIARAMSPETKFIIGDEMTAMLDVITQAQIWKALMTEAQKRNMGVIAVTHDKDLAAKVCTSVSDIRELNDFAS